jgi:hypothetical protein
MGLPYLPTESLYKKVKQKVKVANIEDGNAPACVIASFWVRIRIFRQKI